MSSGKAGSRGGNLATHSEGAGKRTSSPCASQPFSQLPEPPHPAPTPPTPQGPASRRDPSFYSWQSLGLTGGSKRGRSRGGIENSTCQSCSPSPLPLLSGPARAGLGPCGEEVTEKQQQRTTSQATSIRAPPPSVRAGGAPSHPALLRLQLLPIFWSQKAQVT